MMNYFRHHQVKHLSPTFASRLQNCMCPTCIMSTFYLQSMAFHTEKILVSYGYVSDHFVFWQI